MTGLSNTLGRGLLILALGSCAFACGDDDGGGSKPDSGSEAGTGGGGAGKGDDGGAGSGSSDVAACVASTKPMATFYTDECLTCLCTEGADQTQACTDLANCWNFIACYGTKCGDVDPSDMGAATTCATGMCASTIGGASAATPLGMVIRGACSSKCMASAPPTDGGTPGVDGGPDTDGGDTDGGN